MQTHTQAGQSAGQFAGRPTSSGAEIVPLIGRQVQIVQALLAAARSQRDALTAMQTEQLEEACNRQHQLNEELRTLERSRLGQVAAFLGMSRREARGVKMSDLIPNLPQHFREDLERYRSAMAAAALDLQELNKLNRILTERARRFSRETLNVLTNDGQPLYSARI